jgi:hypothetical protein
MMGCGGKSSAQTASGGGKPKTQKQVEAVLKDFSVSFVTESSSQDPFYYKQSTNSKGTFVEIKSERMKTFDDDFNEIFVKYHKIDFIDFTANKVYKLDAITETGKVSTFGAAQAGSYKGFDRVVAQYLFMHERYMKAMKKTGNEKISGRNTTIYIDSEALSYGVDRKFWIDDQYGFPLKFEETHGENRLAMYVTEFIVGDAKVEGLVELGKYEME